MGAWDGNGGGGIELGYREKALDTKVSEFGSCVKVEVAVLGFPS